MCKKLLLWNYAGNKSSYISLSLFFFCYLFSFLFEQVSVHLQALKKRKKEKEKAIASNVIESKRKKSIIAFLTLFCHIITI